jgi:hypothetical protein
MENPPNEKPHKGKGIKKHGGLYPGAVIEEERDRAQRNPEEPKDPDLTQSTDQPSERISDGMRENYSGNTASELNRQE